MTRQEAIWHANHVFNIVIERCINAQNLKDAREKGECLNDAYIVHCDPML